MQIFGYQVGRRHHGLRLEPGPMDEPWFFQGSATGCLVLHGLGGTPANVRIVAQALADGGFTVHTPLLAGHGTTLEDLSKSTWRDWYRSAEEGYERLKAAGCSRIYVIGLSLGGLLSGLLAQRKALAGCGMICPPVVMRSYLRIAALISPLFPFAYYGNNPKKTPDPYYNMLSGMATEKLRDLEVMGKLFSRRIDQITCPLLLIEAGLDDKVSPKTFRLVGEAATQAELQMYRYPRAQHGCTYQEKTREEIARTVLHFVRTREEGQRDSE